MAKSESTVWKEIFQNAEMEVSDSVWSAVEVDLIRTENIHNRRRIIVYQRIAAAAAACIVVLTSYLSYDYWRDRDLNKEFLTHSPVNEQSLKHSGGSNLKSEDVPGDNRSLQQTPIQQRSSTTPTSQQNTNMSVVKDSKANVSRQNESAFMGIGDSQKHFQLSFFMPTIPEHPITLSSKEMRQPDFPRKLPAMPSYFMADTRKQEQQTENMWASVGASGGSYNPGNVSSSTSSTFSQADVSTFSAGNSITTQPQSSQATTGASYSVGVGFGKHISQRWMIQSGLTFLTQQIDYTSNYVSTTPTLELKEAVADYPLTSPVNVAYTSPYTIRSTNEFISIPLQIGYLIINRKFGVQLNAGVASDFFLKNTLKDESGLENEYSQSAGEESPYRNVNWTGLAGVELSHRLADKYRISVVPGVRYTFNSILKDNATLAYNPLVLDIGFRLKYIFN